MLWWIAGCGGGCAVTDVIGTVNVSVLGTCVIDQAQSEEGSNASNPIITTGSAVTREANAHVDNMPAGYDDNLVLTGVYISKGINAARSFIVSGDAGGNDRYSLRSNDTAGAKIQFAYGTGATTIVLSALADQVVDIEYKFLAWINEDEGGALFIDGVEQAFSASLPIINKATTTFSIGSADGVSGINGQIHDIVIKHEKIARAQALAQAQAL